MADISPNITSGPYAANGTQTTFPFDFTALSASEVAVDVNGSEIAPALYTVALASLGGVVTFLSPLPSGSIIVLRSAPDYLQASSFENEGAYKLSTVNTINQRAAVRSLVNSKSIETIAAQVTVLDDRITNLGSIPDPSDTASGIYDDGVWSADAQVVDDGAWG